MATWHITPKDSDTSNHLATFTGTLAAYRFSVLFKAEGFTVDQLPANQIGITVSHSTHSAMSLFLLKYDCREISILAIS
jgi:hypothetical protein